MFNAFYVFLFFVKHPNDCVSLNILFFVGFFSNVNTNSRGKSVAINLSSAANYLHGGLKRRVSGCQKPRLRECCGNRRAGEEMHSGGKPQTMACRSQPDTDADSKVLKTKLQSCSPAAPLPLRFPDCHFLVRVLQLTLTKNVTASLPLQLRKINK